MKRREQARACGVSIVGRSTGKFGIGISLAGSIIIQLMRRILQPVMNENSRLIESKNLR